jgi:hypothetical protein
MTAFMRRIFQKINVWHFAHSRYKQGYFVIDRSVNKGISLGKKFTFSALCSIPLERFS